MVNRSAPSRIVQTHIQTLHVGTQLTMQVLRSKYWMVGMRQAVVCYRQRQQIGDNETTFVGVDNVLSAIRETWESSEMSEELSTRGKNWIFVAPGAPHQGGIWEAAVKSMKHHLRRVIGQQVFTFEQLMTLLVRIEA